MGTRNAVILFCDCHDFSRLQNELGERLFAFMDEFYRRCGECVVTRGGQIIKYLGDAILATFAGDGAGALAAVQAGRCLRRDYAALVLDLNTGIESDMEVGLSSGEIQEGIVGHESLKLFDVFGECVNEAAVIGHHRGIAVTAAVRDQLPPAVALRELGIYDLKWRDEPLRVWEVVDS